MSHRVERRSRFLLFALSLGAGAVALLLLPASGWSQGAPREGTPAPASQPSAKAEDEEDEEEAKPAGAAAPGKAGTPGKPDLGLDRAPFSVEQREFLKEWAERFKAKVLSEVPKSQAPSKISLRWRAETYTKILYQNDQSQGSVSLGTPHPRGDNYSGNNGFASELVLYLDGRVSDRVEVGARLASRFHRQWADFYENGDLALGESGLPSGANATGESLGLNHAAYIQLRGLYVRLMPPIPGIRTFHAGASDLGMLNPWTIGKVRYIDRDNAHGLFLDGAIGSLEWMVARISLPKLYASAGWTSGIDDPLVENPFWTRDASYALKLSQKVKDWISWTWISTYLLDEEADLNDPDALGSTNFIDRRDGVVSTLPRYQNLNSSLEVQINKGFVDVNLFGAYSLSKPDLGYVFNSVDGNQGISPIPMKTAHGYALKARADLADPFGIGLDLRLEYFNIGEDWVATFGARREADVLLTDGFLDGQVPTINVANEFIDFRDAFYESIVGWHGVTFAPRLVRGAFELDAEYSFLEYNTDAQDRCTGNRITDQAGAPIAAQACPRDDRSGKVYGVYPSFLYSDGMTDTDFFSYANTNDRGRDPRSVYRQNQARRTMIGALKAAYVFNVGKGLRWETKLKYIFDRDLRDLDLDGDDYSGHLIFTKTSLGTQFTDEFSATVGFRFDYWLEGHRSGAVVAGRADYPDYQTWKTNVFLDLRYQFGGATLGWYMQWLNKDVDVTRDAVRDEAMSFRFKNVVRGIGTVSASF
ncbi:MAG: hypothetical protein IT371_11670 [Deltaproteobacteria bacterium]|nr:hypothetical protein [Deltaproteobacteria bacterium]